jgi:hypothetical protein
MTPTSPRPVGAARLPAPHLGMATDPFIHGAKRFPCPTLVDGSTKTTATKVSGPNTPRQVPSDLFMGSIFFRRMLFIASSTPPDTIFSVIIGVRRRHRAAVAGFRARVDRCSKWCRRDGLDEQRRPAVRVDRRRVDAPGRGCHSPPLKPWFATRYNWRGRRRNAQRCGCGLRRCS